MADEAWAEDLILPLLDREGRWLTAEEVQEAVGIGPGDASRALAGLVEAEKILLDPDGSYASRGVAGGSAGEAATAEMPAADEDDVVDAGVVRRWLVVWPTGCSWVEEATEEKAARWFAESEEVAELGTGEEIYIVEQGDVRTYATRVMIVKETT